LPDNAVKSLAMGGAGLGTREKMAMLPHCHRLLFGKEKQQMADTHSS